MIHERLSRNDETHDPNRVPGRSLAAEKSSTGKTSCEVWSPSWPIARVPPLGEDGGLERRRLGAGRERGRQALSGSAGGEAGVDVRAEGEGRHRGRPLELKARIDEVTLHHRYARRPGRGGGRADPGSQTCSAGGLLTGLLLLLFS